MSYKVLIIENICPEGIELLKEKGYTVKMATGLKEEDLINDVVDCDAVLVRATPITKAVLEAGKNLKIIARHGIGYNHIDIKAAEELGIWVTNTPQATIGSVAEFTIGGILAVAKRFYECSEAMKKGDSYYKHANKGVDMEGKTLGIIGLGKIGSLVAKKAYFGLDMKILAYVRHAKKENIPEYVELVDWETLFKASDFVSLHMPLTSENKGCVGEKEFELMKKTAFFINCARGGLVDEKALIAVLKKKRIAGAFIDVFEVEPPAVNNPLLNMDNVVATPHMAANTVEAMVRVAIQAASEIVRVLSDEKPKWPINKPQF